MFELTFLLAWIDFKNTQLYSFSASNLRARVRNRQNQNLWSLPKIFKVKPNQFQSFQTVYYDQTTQRDLFNCPSNHDLTDFGVIFLEFVIREFSFFGFANNYQH